MTRRLQLHGLSPTHREEVHQAAWGLVMGWCFAFPVGVGAAVYAGVEYGKSEALLTFLAITLAGAIATAWWSVRRASRD